MAVAVAFPSLPQAVTPLLVLLVAQHAAVEGAGMESKELHYECTQVLFSRLWWMEAELATWQCKIDKLDNNPGRLY